MGGELLLGRLLDQLRQPAGGVGQAGLLEPTAGGVEVDASLATGLGPPRPARSPRDFLSRVVGKLSMERPRSVAAS